MADPDPPDAADREAGFDAVLLQILQAEDAGRPRDADAWLAEFPAYREELLEYFADCAALAGAVAPPEPAPEFPGYEVVRELGRGGMGVVYEARQLDPDRAVALKVLPSARLRTPVERVRFRREARVAARLDHSGIVPIYDIGEAAGVPFYTMKLAPGGPLSRALDRFAADPRAAAVLVAGLARAVHHAHERGVLHRDLKPSNILLDTDGRGLVGDFGLVRDLADPDPLTRTAELVGTPAFMAPEQTHGKAGLVTVAADVYGLGGVLYACLTGGPPFTGANPASVLLQVREADPASPVFINPKVPRDLAAVCLKCLEKDPGRRYRSAAALADDLDRFLRKEPVRAKPIGPVRRAARWVVRRPLPAALAAVAALAVLAAAGLGAWGWQRHTLARADRVAAAERDERHAFELRAAQEAEERQRFYAGLERVRQRRGDPYSGWSGHSLADLRELVALPPARDHAADLRSEAAAALAALDLAPSGSLGNDWPTYGLTYSPDGRYLAAGRWGTAAAGATGVRLYDPATGGTVFDLFIPPDPVSARWTKTSGRQDRVHAVRFSPDSRWLMAGTGSGRLVCWDTKSLEGGPRVWAAHVDRAVWQDAGVLTIAFADDGRTVYSGTRGEIRSWTLGGHPAGPPIPHFRLPASMPVVTRRLPVLSADRWEVQVLDLGRGEIIPGTRAVGSQPLAVAPGGRLLAFMPASSEGPVLRAAEPGARTRPLQAGFQVEMPSVAHLEFDPAGGLLVSVEEHARRVRLWDVAAGRLAAEQGTAGDATRAAFRPDGRRVAVGGRHGVALFDVPNRVLETVGLVAEGTACSMAAAPDHSALLVTAPADGTAPARLYWRGAGSGPQPAEWVLDTWSARPMSDYSPAARRAVYTTDDAQGWYLDSTDGKRWKPNDLQAVRFGPDGRLWILEKDLLRVAIPPGWQDQVVWRNDPVPAATGMVPRCLAVGPDRVFVGRRDGNLIRIDPTTGASTVWPLLSTPVAGLAVSPDGGRLVAGGEGGEVRLVDPSTGRASEIPDAHRGAVPALAFGKTLVVTGSADRRVRLWTPAGEPIATLRMAGPIWKVLLSDDESSLLVLVEGERAVRRWRLDLLFREWAALGLGVNGTDSGIRKD